MPYDRFSELNVFIRAVESGSFSAAALSADLSGKLHIYTLPSFGYTLVPFIAEFVQRFPRVKIDI